MIASFPSIPCVKPSFVRNPQRQTLDYPDSAAYQNTPAIFPWSYSCPLKPTLFAMYLLDLGEIIGRFISCNPCHLIFVSPGHPLCRYSQQLLSLSKYHTSPLLPPFLRTSSTGLTKFLPKTCIKISPSTTLYGTPPQLSYNSSLCPGGMSYTLGSSSDFLLLHNWKSKTGSFYSRKCDSYILQC